MSGSLLDMLRRRTAGTMQDEALRRASEFGAGMLASGSPNFFTMLGAGARAQAEGDRSRTDELRRLADIERQQRALDIEEQRRRDEAQYRADSLRLRREEAERAGRPQYNVVGQDRETGYAIVMDPRNPGQTMTLPGVTPLQVAALNARTDAGREGRATQAGVQAVANAQKNNPGKVFTAQELDTIYQDAFRRAMTNPEGAAAAPAQPAATLDLRRSQGSPPSGSTTPR